MKEMKKTLIIGLGQTGKSIQHFCEREGMGYAIYDDASGQTDVPVWNEVDCVVTSPGVKEDHPVLAKARENNLKVISDIELFARYATAPIIGITGTNGKSTVTTLVTDMVNATGKTALMGGNVGIPALDLLAESAPDFYVLELSSFQLARTFNINAAVGVLLNITEDHLNWHGSMQAYTDAKMRLLDQSKIQVLGAPNVPSSSTVILVPRAKPEGSGIQSTVSSGIARYKARMLNETSLKSSTLSPVLRQTHNRINTECALQVIEALGLPLEPALDVAATFKGLSHRCEHVPTNDGITWIDDSKATNIGAAIAAIESIASTGKLILIAGGQGKGVDFAPLATVINQRVDSVLLLGEDASLIEAACKSSGASVAITHVDSIEDAVSAARQLAHPGDVVLLSPACASFDMFAGFAQRGRVFQKFVLDA
jgi:UDP-N-acetylmuramoylalanine--D-glutamate ligase